MSKSSRLCLGIGAASLAAFGSGCGGGTPTKTLTATNVSNVPPGNANGTALSGNYLITSSTIEGCDCRVGSCGFFHGTPGGTMTVTQQDGSLTFTDSGAGEAAGGVNADDTFTAGGSSPIPDSSGQGEVYTLETGTFEVPGGVPTGMEFQADETITGTVEGGSYDCDLVVSVTARYEGVGYTGTTTHQLPGVSALDLPAGGCTTVNSVSETLPASTISFTVTDANNDSLAAFVVPSGYGCQVNSGADFIADFFVGSATNSGPVPAGTYDLDIICDNTAVDCLISSVTWQAAY